MIPVILLAFANDKQNSGAGYLRGLTLERNAIRDALRKAEENGLCQVLVEPDATVDRIFDIFQSSTYRDRIALFHYGGHADSYSLLLESFDGGKAKAHSEGLVSFLAKQKSLKLVFLNGCSSQNQAEDLVTAGLPAVIGTSQLIQDTIATALATRFYKGMAAGMNIEGAWTDAIDQIKTEQGTENTKGLFVEDILGTPEQEKFPWKLYTGEGGVISKAWNLPEATNQPLFGLELPNSYFRKLPSSPYVGLRSFRRDEAAIFFGRGTDIRKVHTQLGKEQPILLLCGQKGVGKSSLLSAGLIPRLESSYRVSHLEVEGNIPGEALSSAINLAYASEGFASVSTVTKPNLDQKIADVKSSINTTSGFAKEVLENELHRLVLQAGMEQLSFYEKWISVEEKSGLPLVVVLDQLPSDSSTWEGVLEMMVSIFESKSPPKGKLILCLDEDDRVSFAEKLHAAHLPFTEIFLQPLTFDGIHEAISGITQSPATKDFYKLQIEQNSANNFPVVLSGDLLDGEPALVAPYLQVILSALWESAIKENVQSPNFTLRNYQQGILTGEIMDKFLTQQLSVLSSWNSASVQSGLALDLLYLHTSALGKSNLLDASKRKEIYADRRQQVDELVDSCKRLFLLTGNPAAGTYLGHNLLALVVIRQYSISLSPGQQAARILNAKSDETSALLKNSWLNEADLDIVERGMQGMRHLSKKEEALLEFSRTKKLQAQLDRKRNRIIRGVLVSIVTLFAILAGWQWRVANHRYLYSRAGELAFTAREISKQDHTLGLNIAQKAYSALEEKSPPLVILALSDIFHTQDEMPFYSADFPHSEKVFSAVFSPDGKEVLTASEDGLAKLWNLKGKLIVSLSHEIEVKMAAFSPNGQQILTLTRTHVRLWERNGTLTDQDSIPETLTSLESFSSDGMKIIPAFSDADASTYTSLIEKLREENTLVIPSPALNRILLVQNSICRLLNSDGIILKDSIAVGVIHANFSRDGKQFLTITPDSVTSRIHVFNDAADLLYSFSCVGTEVSAEFSPDNKSILTASNDFTAKLWDFSSPFLHYLPKQQYAINTVDFFQGGDRYLTSSFDSTAKIYDGAGKLIDVLHHGDVVNTASFAPDGDLIVTASRDGTARIWKPKNSNVTILKHHGEVTSSIFSRNGKYVLTTSLDSLARIWDTDGNLIHSLQHKGDVLWADFSPDDNRIITLSSDSAVTLWDMQGNALHQFKHPARVYSAIFSNDNQKLLTSCADSIVRQWSMEGKLLLALPHSEKPKFTLFTKDSQYILTGGRAIKIWRADGTLIDSLPHQENVSSIDVSPDGHYILTTCFDHKAYLWNFSGELLATYRKHTAKINYGVFTSDGKHILTASDDGFVYRWRTPGAIYRDLKTTPVYQLTRKQQELYGIIR